MSWVGRTGEELARRMNRRKVVKRTAATTFGAVAAWSVRGVRGAPELARHCAYITAGDCSCNPPYGQYCNGLDESYCSGAACTNGCYIDESWRYVGGCWCSATCEYSDEAGNPLVGYYKCCDCNCYGSQCTCREFVPVQSRPPRPDNGGSDNPFPPGFPFNH